MIAYDAEVQALMRDVAARIVMPRFRMLDAAEIEEKAPDELVTIADKESEIALAEGLTRMLPGSRVIGEEACSADSTAQRTSRPARRRSGSWSHWSPTGSAKRHGC